MGWAARANPVAQAAKRREIAPKQKPERKPSVREKSFMRLWDKMQARIKQAESDAVLRAPVSARAAMRSLMGQ